MINHRPIQNSKVPTHSRSISKRSSALRFSVQNLRQRKWKKYARKKERKVSFSLFRWMPVGPFSPTARARPNSRWQPMASESSSWIVQSGLVSFYKPQYMKIRTKQDIFFTFFQETQKMSFICLIKGIWISWHLTLSFALKRLKRTLQSCNLPGSNLVQNIGQITTLVHLHSIPKSWANPHTHTHTHSHTKKS
jgi:hypothetical protein